MRAFVRHDHRLDEFDVAEFGIPVKMRCTNDDRHADDRLFVGHMRDGAVRVERRLKARVARQLVRPLMDAFERLEHADERDVVF